MDKHMVLIKIDPEKLKHIARIVFDKSRYSGRELARRLGLNPNTLWSWYDRGLPVDQALASADIFNEWAVELLLLSRELRKLAEERIKEEQRRILLSPTAAATDVEQPRTQGRRRNVVPESERPVRTDGPQVPSLPTLPMDG